MLKNIIKSPNDIRAYRTLGLSNKIDCLLISDKEADKSAASLNVNVGQVQDPFERPGLAHFLEHMLFLGTKKYPNQNDYSSYITSNSGSNNAYTALCNTNYFFDCSNTAFEGALDRFSQFFIHPLFTESCTDREINAVHSEHEKNLMSDLWRKMQLFRSSAVDGHPYNKFGTGNKQTLHHPSIRSDLMDFYKKYYSSNLMKLVIYGKEDLPTLEKWAQEFFSSIPNFDTAIPKVLDPAFTRESLGTFWKVLPIKDTDQLEFMWIIDNLTPHFRNNPGTYISHLIGHEGPNSLLSYLIDEGLALELSSGFSSEMNLFSKFTIGVRLTKKGLQNHQEVSRIVFEYLKMLRERGVEERIFEEIKQILKIGFNFKDKESPMNYTMSLSERMHYFPIEEVVRLNYLMEDFNPDLIKGVLRSLTADNMRVYLSSKDVEKDCDSAEKWYGTKYSCKPFTSEYRQMFENPGVSASKSGKTLNLPPTNIFVPTNFEIFAKNHTELPNLPQKVYESDRTEIYYKQDNRFLKPKASMHIKLYSDDLNFGTDLKTFMLLDLWVKTFYESLREILYLASSASLGVGIDVDSEGLEITISGYNDSIERVSSVLFERMHDFEPQRLHVQFENIRETLLKSLNNFYKNPPYQQAMSYQSSLLKKGGDTFLPEEEISTLENITFNDLLSFHANWFKTTRLEGLFVGNITQDKVIEISKNVERITSSMREKSSVLPKDRLPEVRVVNLPQNTTWFFEHESRDVGGGLKESNSAVISLFQFEKETPHLRMIMSVLSNYLREPCFDRLRTDEQLGYIVSGFNADMRGIMNYVVLIQSNIKCPQYLSSRVLVFLEDMKERINQLTDEEFQKHVESIRVKILHKDLSIRQEGSRYWSEITTHRYIFDRKEKDLEQLQLVKKSDVISLFEQIFFNNRKSFETHVISLNHLEENNKLKAERLKSASNVKQAWSPSSFKKRMPLYPDFAASL